MCSSDLPGTKEVAFMVEKHLCLVDQPSKRGGVHDAVPIALKVISRGCAWLGVAPATAAGVVAGVTSQGRQTQASQDASMTRATRSSGADRTTTLPGASISTKLIWPASAFLSSRMCSM